MPTNFHLAPPAKTVDGLLAAPIDIESIDAKFTFDGAAATASADATITYTVGPTAGNPIFDLRQNITQAWVDGTLFPAAQLAHHDFGVGPFTDLRVIQSVQAAGSVHTLRVQYGLAMPNSQLGGSYLPALEWSAGPKLRFVFGFSDLNRARYAEAWLPANLIFDQFSIKLDIQIINTLAVHSVITNGAVTSLGTNHWQIDFPARSSAVSSLLEIRATDTVTQLTGTVVLPVSGKTVAIEAWKPVSSAVNLPAQIDAIKSLLADNENDYGAYLHDNRFVAFFNGTGGMEYEGGTTTSMGALLHETFHSWFARGIKPASQADGWWDEGFTTFHDDGADDAIPFDFADPPIVLCSRDPWQRHTPTNSYSDGARFWKGMASLLGVANLNALMGGLYESRKGNPVSTQMIEEMLLSRGGVAQVVDAFHRFVYGLADPALAPDLWLKDDPAHGGSDDWDGAFWDSPDLWIRNADDGGAEHQPPESGQDNWFHARVRNKAGAGAAEHFVVTFNAKGFAGTQFVYPIDFLPCIAAKAEFALAPGDTRIVKALWPRHLVPPAGSHTCLLASVSARADHPVSGRHVWEHNNLAQKNLLVVDLLPDNETILPIVVANSRHNGNPRFKLELWLPKGMTGVNVSLIHRTKEFFRQTKQDVKRFENKNAPESFAPQELRLECGSHSPGPRSGRHGSVMTADLARRRFHDSWEAEFPRKNKSGLAVEIPPLSQYVVGLRIVVGAQAKAGQSSTLHLVQRQSDTREIIGGVAVKLNVGMKT